MIVGPGRVRALVQNPAGSTGTRVLQNTFLIREVGDQGQGIFATGECPGLASEPQGMALLGSDRTGVVCKGADSAYFGEVTAAGGPVKWRWRERLGSREGNPPQDVPYFAELGDKVVLIYQIGHTKGSPNAPPYAVQIAPGPSEYRPLCAGDRCVEKIVTLLVLERVLHVIWTSEYLESQGWYGELTITGTGELRSTDVTPTTPTTAGPTFDPRDRLHPCVSQGRDGAVTISLPGARVLRYEKAMLPLGPDVYPTEVALCPPSTFDDPTPPKLPNEFRRGIRATLGSHWVIVYGLPSLGGPGAQYAYPGSLRVFIRPDKG